MEPKLLNSEFQYGNAAENRKLCLYFQHFLLEHKLSRFFKGLTVTSLSLLEVQTSKFNAASVLRCTT